MIKTCIICGKQFKTSHKNILCCSIDCSKKYRKTDAYSKKLKKIWASKSSDEINKISNKKKQTCVDRYGCEYTFQDESTKEKIKKTNIKKYGVDNPSKSQIIIDKIKHIKEEKYGDPNYNNIEQTRETCVKKYGVDNVFKIPNKIKKAVKDKYGVENPSQLLFVKNKKISTMKTNNSYGKSSDEEYINKKLSNYYVVNRQYSSKMYPFPCDFYISELDLYIEYQGFWTHGKHPFNINDQEDKLKLLEWKNKNTKMYNCAINTWTIRDPLKRKTAKENNLNWVEFFTVEEFNEWFESINKSNL